MWIVNPGQAVYTRGGRIYRGGEILPDDLVRDDFELIGICCRLELAAVAVAPAPAPAPVVAPVEAVPVVVAPVVVAPVAVEPVEAVPVPAKVEAPAKPARGRRIVRG